MIELAGAEPSSEADKPPVGGSPMAVSAFQQKRSAIQPHHPPAFQGGKKPNCSGRNPRTVLMRVQVALTFTQLDGAAPVFAICIAESLCILTSSNAVPLQTSATGSLALVLYFSTIIAPPPLERV
ncbi:MAG: hypothetical protein ORN29_00805 [Rhodoferax sp.]|nr:hypothetical protein [Rhodoferax sp.]